MWIPGTRYAAASDAKRVARIELYERVVELQPQHVRDNGVAMVLAGTNAGELGCLKHLLKMRAEQVIFVDNYEVKGLVRVQKEWPGVRTFYGDIATALQGLRDPLAFVNFDFTGYLNKKRELAVELSRTKLMPMGFVGYTFYKGREMMNKGIWSTIRALPTSRTVDHPPRFRSDPLWQPVLEEKRFVGYSARLCSKLGEHAEPVFMLRYGNRGNPMGVLGFQVVPPSLRDTVWTHRVENSPKAGARGGVITPDQTDIRLRSKVVALVREGFDSYEIADIMEVDVRRVAAWRAHETRGTYRDTDVGNEPPFYRDNGEEEYEE